MPTMEVLAHTGGGIGGLWDGLVHPVTGVDHLLAMVAVGVLAAVVADRRVAVATPAAFVAGMVTGGVLGIAGIAAGVIETTIAASIVGLGGLIVLTLVGSLRLGWWVPAAALAVGAVHGIAHGGEIPDHASAFAYVAGFVAATIALHVAGTLLGATVGRHPAARTAVAGTFCAAGLALLAGIPG